MNAARAAVTFDFDTLSGDLYRDPVDAATRRRLERVSFEKILPRILDWLDGQGIAATFFVIGRHVSEHGAWIATIARRGHEVANHSFHHHREFASLPPAAIAEQIALAHEAIAGAAGRAPAGFRAPGYTVNANVIAALSDLGYEYDASVVPSWLYSATKHAYRMLGGSDFREYLHPQSVRCMTAPKQPYPIHPRALFAPSREARLLEIPQTVVGPAQFPLIYGVFGKVPVAVQQWLVRMAQAQPFVTIGFHDLEFVTAEDLSGLPVGALTRFHVAQPIDARLARLTAMMTRLAVTHQFGVMREIAAAYLTEPEAGVAGVEA